MGDGSVKQIFLHKKASISINAPDAHSGLDNPLLNDH
jgi:hypothetical protein